MPATTNWRCFSRRTVRSRTMPDGSWARRGSTTVSATGPTGETCGSDGARADELNPTNASPNAPGILINPTAVGQSVVLAELSLLALLIPERRPHRHPRDLLRLRELPHLRRVGQRERLPVHVVRPDHRGERHEPATRWRPTCRRRFQLCLRRLRGGDRVVPHVPVVRLPVVHRHDVDGRHLNRLVVRGLQQRHAVVVEPGRHHGQRERDRRGRCVPPAAARSPRSAGRPSRSR